MLCPQSDKVGWYHHDRLFSAILDIRPHSSSLFVCPMRCWIWNEEGLHRSSIICIASSCDWIDWHTYEWIRCILGWQVDAWWSVDVNRFPAWNRVGWAVIYSRCPRSVVIHYLSICPVIYMCSCNCIIHLCPVPLTILLPILPIPVLVHHHSLPVVIHAIPSEYTANCLRRCIQYVLHSLLFHEAISGRL